MNKDSKLKQYDEIYGKYTSRKNHRKKREENALNVIYCK